MKIGITNLELHEYFQNGCIRVKDTMMDFSHSETYVYYGHEAGYKQYRKIDFEEEFDMYRYRGNGKSECYVELFAYKCVHPEYGMLLIENHHENYLVELREKEHIDKLLRLSKRRGYHTEFVLCLNWKCWEHFNRDNRGLAVLYHNLYYKAADEVMEHYKNDQKALLYYHETTD